MEFLKNTLPVLFCFLCGKEVNPHPIVNLVTPSNTISGLSLFISVSNFYNTLANNVVYFWSTRVSITTSITTLLAVDLLKRRLYEPLSIISLDYYYHMLNL